MDANWTDDRVCIDPVAERENMENHHPVGVPAPDRAVRVIRPVDDHILEIADENKIKIENNNEKRLSTQLLHKQNTRTVIRTKKHSSSHVRLFI